MARHKFFANKRNFDHPHCVTGGGLFCNAVGYSVMVNAATYRRRAEDCATRAREAQDDYHRKNFAELAAMWTEMADKAEGREQFAVDAQKLAEKKLIDDALATIRNV